MRGWEYIDNFGNLRIYGKGNIRRIVDQKGNIIVEYKV